VIGEEDLPDRLGGSLLPWNKASRSLPAPRPCRPGHYVGLIRVEGMIVDGRSRRLPLWPPSSLPLLLEEQCGDLTVVQQARQLAQNRRVGAVLLWVDSRGGSASASEAMHAALKALAHRKPLVAAMGSVAASGGYYIVAPARRIFAQSGTLTGSIGVLAGKLTFGGLLDLLLVNRQTTTRGENVFMDRPDQMYTDRERTLVHDMIDRIYDLFLDRVCQGRNRSREAIEPLAGGRVWTGRQALARGLVDEMGGLPQALAAARSLGNLPEDAPLLELPLKAPSVAPASPASSIEHALRAVEALGRTGAWLLSPLISAER
jgi:protease-4